MSGRQVKPASDPLVSFEIIEEAHGWRFGSNPHYPDILCIACPCGHMSVRDRDEVKGHVCPSCGRGQS